MSSASDNNGTKIGRFLTDNMIALASAAIAVTLTVVNFTDDMRSRLTEVERQHGSMAETMAHRKQFLSDQVDLNAELLNLTGAPADVRRTAPRAADIE